MKNALTIICCAVLFIYGTDGVPAQHKQKVVSDTTGIKNNNPKKQLRKENERNKKATLQDVKLLRPDILNIDRPLLFKEKDSLQTKQK